MLRLALVYLGLHLSTHILVTNETGGYLCRHYQPKNSKDARPQIVTGAKFLCRWRPDTPLKPVGHRRVQLPPAEPTVSPPEVSLELPDVGLRCAMCETEPPTSLEEITVSFRRMGTGHRPTIRRSKDKCAADIQCSKRNQRNGAYFNLVDMH